MNKSPERLSDARLRDFRVGFDVRRSGACHPLAMSASDLEDAFDALLAEVERVRSPEVRALASNLPRPAKDAAVYDRLYEAWNALSFDVTTMPPAAKDAAITACREELDAVLKGFEGRSFTSWCDAQWADGSGRVSLPPNRPATGEPAPTCATRCVGCDNGWPIDYQDTAGSRWHRRPDDREWPLSMCLSGGAQ